MAGPTTVETLTQEEVEVITKKVFELFMVGGGTRKVPDVLHHYTDSNGLKGIIESGALRATHVSYLNDASEYLHAVNVLLEKVAQAQAGQRAPLEVELLQEMEPLLKATRAENVNHYFVTCFSEEPNSLNQWRAYGKGEGAFSIGFVGSQLHNNGLRVGAM